MIGFVAVITVVCAVVAVTTLILLDRNLTMQLDTQLRQVQAKSQFYGDPGGRPGIGGRRSTRGSCRAAIRRTAGCSSGPASRSAPSTARSSDGRCVGSGILTGTGPSTAVHRAVQQGRRRAARGARRRPGARRAHLRRRRLPRDRRPRSRTGSTRRRPGLPTADNDALLLKVGLIMAAVVGLALIGGAAAVFWIVGRSLRPLQRVASTARQVSTMPLDRGEVDIGVRVPERDTDPRTEVGQVGAALNQMLGHVSDALTARQASETRVRQFVADASHELRTPLAAIRGYAELARRDEADTDGVAHALRRVESESARMTTLVDDLLLLARLDSGRPLSRDEVDLTMLVVDAVSDARVAGPDHRWQMDLPEEPVTTIGDSARLHQVLANLLANARTHTPPGTVVSCGLRSDRHGAVITVTDNGPGIPPELQAEVFNRFVRGDSSRSRAAGSTGLGLAIVSAVTAAHGGSVGRAEPARAHAVLGPAARARRRPAEPEPRVSRAAPRPGPGASVATGEPGDGCGRSTDVGQRPTTPRSTPPGGPASRRHPAHALPAAPRRAPTRPTGWTRRGLWRTTDHAARTGDAAPDASPPARCARPPGVPAPSGASRPCPSCSARATTGRTSTCRRIPLLTAPGAPHPGLHIPRTGMVFDVLAAAVLEQRVVGADARRGWRMLIAQHGDPAPGPAPAGMRVRPPPSAWGRIPSWDWHLAGVDPGRARTVGVGRPGRTEPAAHRRPRPRRPGHPPSAVLRCPASGRGPPPR